MKKFRKALAMVLCFVLGLAVAIAGAYAYFMDTDEDVNVAVVGKIYVEQLEYERVVDQNGKWVESEYTGYGYTADEMQEYTNDKPLLPMVGGTRWDNRNGSEAATGDKSHQQPWSQVGAPGSNQLFDDSTRNVHDKFVFVKNTGTSNAYYRTVIAVEAPEGITSVGNYPAIMLNKNGNSRFTWDTDIGYITIDGARYYLVVATYNEKLAAGEISRPSLLQYYLRTEVTNEEAELFGDKAEIKVFTQAVQADGFESAADALNTAFGGAVTTENHPWLNTESGDTEEPEVEATPVTPENFENIKLEDGGVYSLRGTFNAPVTLSVNDGSSVTLDGSEADFQGEGTVTVNAPGVAHAYSSLDAERKGVVTVKGFEVQTLNVLAYNNEQVNIVDNKANAMSVIGGNFALNIEGNLIDGNFGQYTDGENQNNEYGISMRITDYELSMSGNTITDTYSHAIGINGRQGEASSDWGDCGKNNKIVKFTGNNITLNTTYKTKRGALKIWCDQVYAPYATSGHAPNDAAKALMAEILADTSNKFTLGEGHYIFNIFDYMTNDGK